VQDGLERRQGRPRKKTAREIVGQPVIQEDLADLLWVVFMLPEFQLIR
jgi:hypothetical protein